MASMRPGPLADGLTTRPLAASRPRAQLEVLHAHRPEQQVSGLDGEGQGLLFGRADSPVSNTSSPSRMGCACRPLSERTSPASRMAFTISRTALDPMVPVASAHGSDLFGIVGMESPVALHRRCPLRTLENGCAASCPASPLHCPSTASRAWRISPCSRSSEIGVLTSIRGRGSGHPIGAREVEFRLAPAPKAMTRVLEELPVDAIGLDVLAQPLHPGTQAQAPA